MRRAGGGSIVNLGSTNASPGLPNLFAYSCAKGGLLTLTRNLARALAPDRIRANLLNPGWVISEGEVVVQALEGHDTAWIEAIGRQPLGRRQAAEDTPGPPSSSPRTSPRRSPASSSTATPDARCPGWARPSPSRLTHPAAPAPRVRGRAYRSR